MLDDGLENAADVFRYVLYSMFNILFPKNWKILFVVLHFRVRIFFQCHCIAMTGLSFAVTPQFYLLELLDSLSTKKSPIHIISSLSQQALRYQPSLLQALVSSVYEESQKMTS